MSRRVAYFVRRVGELSHGEVRIQVRDGWGNYQPDFEQQIVRDVRADKADLAWVGTRVFDTLGVKSFQALTAPMLIDSYPLERAVIASDMPTQMLQSLRPLGVTGLAVLGDGLRKPIAVEAPLLGPADWKGITFQVFRSQGEAEAIRALGAIPDDTTPGRLVDGEVQGAEKNLHIYQVGRAYTTGFPYVTANVSLWPQTVALLANPARLSGLTLQQRRWLTQAAADASARSTGLLDRETAVIAAACGAGAQFANASDAQLAALRTEFGPVYTMLERDPQSKSFIERIQALKRTTPAGPALAIPLSCTGSTGPPPSVDPVAGIWTTGKVTESQWVHAFIGAGGSEEGAHSSWTGGYTVITLEFQDGVFKFFGSTDGGPASLGETSYEVSTDGILTLDDPTVSCAETYRIALKDDVLRLRPLRRCPDDIYRTMTMIFPLTRSS